MNLRKFFAVILVTFFLAASAHAADLHQARSSGQVGEKLDGYVAALKPSSDINAFVADVNAKRKAQYGKISQQNGQPVDVVAKLAAQQVINTIEPGSMYQAADGSWKKR